MGNCADVILRPAEEKIRVLVFNEGEKEFSARTPVGKITSGPYSGFKLVHHSQPDSPLLPDARLQPGDLYYLVPLQAQPHQPPIPSRTANQETGKQKKVKIVVTKDQLELLLRSTEKFKSKDIAIHCLGSFRVGEGRRKWRPSLTMIPEVHSF